MMPRMPEISPAALKKELTSDIALETEETIEKSIKT